MQTRRWQWRDDSLFAIPRRGGARRATLEPDDDPARGRSWTSEMTDLLLRHVRLWGETEPTELLLQGGRIAARGALPAPPPQVEVIDGSGLFVLPGLVDGHAHLDKTLWGTPWRAHAVSKG